MASLHCPSFPPEHLQDLQQVETLEEHQNQDHPKDHLHQKQLEELGVEVVVLEQEQEHQVLGQVEPEEQAALELVLG